MKIMNKLLASASALAICLSSSLGATETNNWFTVDFEDGYTANAAIVGASQTGGVWSKTGADASTMTNMTSPAKGKIGKLDTQGDQLTWTPTAASTKDVVLIDTDVYLVGSDEPPTTVATDAQTEVYLKNVLDGNGQVVSSVLCAHVKDGGQNTWVDLDGVAITNQTWVKLRIEMDYKNQNDPKVSFWVNEIRMEKVSTATWSFSPMTSAEKVTSVSFMGTGYIDNFVGREVTELANAPTVQEGWNGGNTNGTNYAVSGNTMSVSFPNSQGTGVDEVDLQYVQLTGPGDYVRTYRTSVGNEAAFDVSGLAPGSYTVTAYYGAAPTVVPEDYTPAAEAKDAIPAAAVVEDGGSKFLRVNVKPVSGLYYTLFVGTDGVDSLKAGAASVLALPDDEDDETLTIDLPVPTGANDVNLIKIYASDENYAKDANAPVAP